MTNKLVNTIQQFKLFKHCSGSFHQSLASQARILDLQKGKLLFIHESEAERFYIILNGWVKLFRETLDGAQAIIDILPANHIFGETAIFQDNKHSYSAEIVEQANIISLPLDLLKSEIESNPKLAISMMSSMAQCRRHQSQELENRTFKNAPQRIGCFLLRLIDPDQSGSVSIHLPYDKTLVASRLGMQPETFSRALNQLKKQINMNVNGSTLKINNVTDLINYTCSSCSSEFPCHELRS